MKFNQKKESKYLYLKPSHIENAGKGLYTKVDIAKGGFIAAYTGFVIDMDEAIRRMEDGKDQFFVDNGDGNILDSLGTQCFAMYANDANGLTKSHLKNNARITLTDHAPSLFAMRNIKAGEEILTGYGAAYWKNVRDRIKELGKKGNK